MESEEDEILRQLEETSFVVVCLYGPQRFCYVVSNGKYISTSSLCPGFRQEVNESIQKMEVMEDQVETAPSNAIVPAID